MPSSERALESSPVDRRAFLAAGGALAAGLALGNLPLAAAQEKKAEEPFALGALPYPHDALEPSIDRQTMEIHHGRHHAAYVQNLNKAVAGTPFATKPIEELLRGLASLPADLQTAVRNHGGGHHNHTLFWTSMKPKGGGEPSGKLGEGIRGAFGGFDKLKAALSDKAMKQFGSGWAWLVQDKGKLAVISLPNQDSPLAAGQTPLLGVDVWEHAYYLKYQNRRADYLAAWWNVVDWDAVAKRMA